MVYLRATLKSGIKSCVRRKFVANFARLWKAWSKFLLRRVNVHHIGNATLSWSAAYCAGRDRVEMPAKWARWNAVCDVTVNSRVSLRS